MTKPIAETELILNADGSAYHLNLLPGDVADTVLTVGDQERVAEVSRYFDRIELRKGKREFITHTGYVGNKRITVISTGIGTDNVDIVLNELDALVNIDFQTRLVREQLKSLDIVRIGTSGAVQPNVAIDSLLVSSAAIGLDPLLHYYDYHANAAQQQLLEAFKSSLPSGHQLHPYIAPASAQLLHTLASEVPQGITVTAPGFYAPQSRQVRARSAMPDLLASLYAFDADGQRITNLEMETAGIYGLAAILGHRAISFNVILANRITKQFSNQPHNIMDRYIRDVLERITTKL